MLALLRRSSAGVQLLLGLRFVASLAFHVYNVSFMPSLKARFNMGPKDFGAFMGLVGMVYAGSQLLVAKPLISWAAQNGGEYTPSSRQHIRW